MPNLIASLNKNVLKLTLNSETSFQTASIDVSKDIADDTKIINANEFSQILYSLLSEFSNIKPKKLDLTFLVEPTDVVLHFVTIDKDTEDVDAAAVAKMKEKLNGSNLDDLYFSYQKIAPFVYQIIGVKREFLDIYLEIANNLQMPLKGVVPWVLLLPKFLESNDPCVFLFEETARQTVALSELNGVYFCETFDKNKTSSELTELVKKLSVYKREDPINKVYTLSDNTFGLEKEFDVAPLVNLSDKYKDAKGFEIHMLAEEVLFTNLGYMTTQINLLNLLPVPVVEKKNVNLVYVGSFVAAFALVLAGFGIYYKLSPGNNVELAINNSVDVTVVSEQPSEETVANGIENVAGTSDEVVESAEELNKEDVSIRIENGAGISGIAGSAQDFLEEKGWRIFNIGNADTSYAQTTSITFKEDSLKYKDLLVEDMKDDYEVVVAEDTLSDSEEFDILVVVGSN